MFGTVDAGMLLLVALMVALGVVPGLLALSSDRTRMQRPRRSRPTHRFHFGAATAARWDGQGIRTRSAAG